MAVAAVALAAVLALGVVLLRRSVRWRAAKKRGVGGKSQETWKPGWRVTRPHARCWMPCVQARGNKVVYAEVQNSIRLEDESSEDEEEVLFHS
jgi:hypothetical protein